MELSQKIHENEDIRLKTIPYLFITTIAEQDAVIDANSKSIQVKAFLSNLLVFKI
jgi:hypothetical protein